MELFALDATSGEELWKFRAPLGDNSGLGLNRGLVYWKSEDNKDHRIYFSVGSKLYAINAQNGEIISSFGKNGAIDLRDGLEKILLHFLWCPTRLGLYSRTSSSWAPRVSEGPGASPGHIRAYDVLTGEIVWKFHTIPFPGEFGYDTWPKEAYKEYGGANSWAGMSLDKENGIVYIQQARLPKIYMDGNATATTYLPTVFWL